MIAVIVTVLFGATVAALGRGGADDEPTSTTTDSVAREDLSADAQELLTLLERKEDETYHAVYEGSSPEAPGGVRLESWQAPPAARQDTVLAASGQAASTTTIVSPDGTYRCTALGVDQPVTCRALPGAEAGAADPVGAIIDRLTEGTVIRERTSIDRRAVDCFTLTTGEGVTELCLNDVGIPVRVLADGSELRLVSLDTDVPSEIFLPPGPVVG